MKMKFGSQFDNIQQVVHRHFDSQYDKFNKQFIDSLINNLLNNSINFVNDL